jgi:hypothetical protein
VANHPSQRPKADVVINLARGTSPQIETSKNMTNEPEHPKNVIIANHQEPVEVTANLGMTSGPGSEPGNRRVMESGFSKMPVSSMLVLGVSNPHHHEGDRHGRPSYVLVLVYAIRAQPGRGTA